MQFAKINGVVLHHQLIGAPEGRPVLVFINSLGTDFRMWRDVIVHLAGEAAIVAYDKRGHGLSDVGAAPYRMEDHVADLIGLLDHLNVGKAVLCGASVGGMVAQGLYHSAPERVRGLILCGTAARIGDEAMWNGRIETVWRDGIAALSEGILERWFTEAFRAEQNADLAGYRNMLERTPVEGYVGTCAALRDADYTAQTPSIAVPALCMVGEKDGSTPPALVHELAEGIGSARFEIIADAGHLPSIEQPDSVVALVRSFLAGLSSNGAASEGLR